MKKWHYSPIKLLQALLFTVLLVAIQPGSACAVQWQSLTQTGRYNVSLEMTSLRTDEFGNRNVWLKFVPRSELRRREAARDYDKKNYRLHLELYEITCTEKSARLTLIDILDKNGKRLARIPGNDQPDPILSDSVLERVAQRICPVEDEDTGGTDEELPDTVDQTTTEPADMSQISEEHRQRIENAQLGTKDNPKESSSWIELGNAYFDADLPQKAVEAYDQALRLNPNDTNVLNDQGAMYRQSGDVNRALKSFEKALAIDPRNQESLYNMGYIYAIDMNRISRGLEIWKRYLELDPSSETADQVRSFIKRYENNQELR